MMHQSLKGHHVVFAEEIQTQNFTTYSINEEIFVFP